MSTSLHAILSKASDRLRARSETPTLDAQVLLAHFIGKPRSWVIAHPEFQLDPQQYDLISQALHRLESGEPLPYVLGHWEFYGLDFDVTPQVLIPRPETELLVEHAIHWLRLHENERRVIDVGTGSGCIGIAIAKNIPDLHLLLTDISPSTLEIARHNAEKHGLRDKLKFLQSDLLEGIQGTFDVICANMPYIPRQSLSELPVAAHEPSLALDGGQKGTELIFKLLDQSTYHLALGGLLLMEIEASQGSESKSYAQSIYPTSTVEILRDLPGHDRCLKIERSSLIVHLCQQGDWVNAQERGAYVSQSFDREGFIHCSTPEQILRVANNFYRGLPNLLLLWINPQAVVPEIHWEPVGLEVFPHIYGPINTSAVVKTTVLQPDADGYFRRI